MSLIFPVQVSKSFRGALTKTPSGRTCAPDAASGWRPRLWDSFLSPRGKFTHHAIDIVAAEGSMVRAAEAGRVLDTWRGNPGAGWSEKGGWYVWIKDSRGNIHYYAHLQKPPRVRSGQSVRKGQIIGYVGRTGNAKTTCPHLHYAITDSRGRKVNPFPLLKPQYDARNWISTEPTGGGAALLVAALAGSGLWWYMRSRRPWKKVRTR